MDNFEIQSDFTRRLKFIADGPYLLTERGVKHLDPRIVSPGVANIGRLAKKFCQGQGLDIGSSYFEGNISNGLPGATPVDIAIPGSGDAENLIQGSETQRYVFASHVLEHLDNPEKAMSEAYRVLVNGGWFFTYQPYPGHPQWDPNLSESVRNFHKWQPTPGIISRMMIMAGFSIYYSEWEKDHLWSFIVIGRK